MAAHAKVKFFITIACRGVLTEFCVSLACKLNLLVFLLLFSRFYASAGVKPVYEVAGVMFPVDNKNFAIIG